MAQRAPAATNLTIEEFLLLETPEGKAELVRGELRLTPPPGALRLAQALMPGMISRGYGRVVNVSSSAGQISSMGDYAPPYLLSKAALNAFTRLLASTGRGRDVLVNAVDPGWVRTDMGGAAAPRSVEQGADTIVWCATLPKGGPSGRFFHDRKEIAW